MGGRGSCSQTKEAYVPVIDEGWKTERASLLWSAQPIRWICFVCFFLEVNGNSQLVLHHLCHASHFLMAPSKTEGWRSPANSDWWWYFCTLYDGVTCNETRGIKKRKESGCGLHCLVPSCINSTQFSAEEIPFVIPFALPANSLISLSLGPAYMYVCMCWCVCIPGCVSLSFSHLSVKESIDHYLGPSSIHTNGLHYLLINTDGWRWAIWQLITGAFRGWRLGGFAGVAPAHCPDWERSSLGDFWLLHSEFWLEALCLP